MGGLGVIFISHSLRQKAVLRRRAHAQFLYTPINMISMADCKYANDRGDVERMFMLGAFPSAQTRLPVYLTVSFMETGSSLKATFAFFFHKRNSSM